MKKFIIGASAMALLAGSAWAIADKDHHGMRAPQSRAEVEARMKEHFAMVDANKDGAITKEEADTFKSRRRAEMHDKMFSMLDTDKNGQISRQEFDARHGDGMGRGQHMGAMHGHHGGMMMHGGMFSRADANNDGKVTLAEATSKALERFDRVDANKDGTVTPEERREGWRTWKEERHIKAN